ncbi:hypothetical protein M1D97_06175 [Kushneria sp. AK178]
MQKKGIGDFFFTIILWILIGGLAQWLMQHQLNGNGTAVTGMSTGDNMAEGVGFSSYWSALGLVALFFAVIAFMARDLMRDNPVTRSLKVIGTRLLSTTFDIGLFALGGTLFLMLSPAASHTVPQWQALFIGISLPFFIVILVVLGVIWCLLRFSRLSLVSIPALEFKPLVRVALYVGLLAILVLAAWLAL